MLFVIDYNDIFNYE